MDQIEFQCRVLNNQQLNPQTAILTLEAPQIAARAKPGQFVNISCNQFLRRPIGIMDADPEAGWIKCGIQIVGEGTRWLAGLKTEDQVSVLGPLGHGFDLDGIRRVITVGGGTGVFPLYFVQRYCQAKGIVGIAVCGYRSRTDSIITDEYNDAGCQTLFASDCGDLPFHGNAGQALEHLLQNITPVADTAILTCGPKIMMKNVASIAAAYKLSCQVSLEERMACGVGVCLVCACATKSGDSGQGVNYQRCCAEGPVFPAEVIEWSI